MILVQYIILIKTYPGLMNNIDKKLIVNKVAYTNESLITWL